MRTPTFSAIACAVVLAGLTLGGPASAQDPEDFIDSVGAREFERSCATCHGESAKGDGPMAALLTVKPADLTQLAKQNGGEFPLVDIVRIIDGRNGLRGHGSAMPVWGDRFAMDAEQQFGVYDQDAIVRGRILELAFYLQLIQER